MPRRVNGTLTRLSGCGMLQGGVMLGRIANLFKAFLNVFIGSVERQNPEALLALNTENLRQPVANFTRGLATHAGVAERLMGQVRKLEIDQKDLRAKAAASPKAGNKSPAG